MAVLALAAGGVAWGITTALPGDWFGGSVGERLGVVLVPALGAGVFYAAGSWLAGVDSVRAILGILGLRGQK